MGRAQGRPPRRAVRRSPPAIAGYVSSLERRRGRRSTRSSTAIRRTSGIAQPRMLPSRNEAITSMRAPRVGARRPAPRRRAWFEPAVERGDEESEERERSGHPHHAGATCWSVMDGVARRVERIERVVDSRGRSRGSSPGRRRGEPDRAVQMVDPRPHGRRVEQRPPEDERRRHEARVLEDVDRLVARPRRRRGTARARERVVADVHRERDRRPGFSVPGASGETPASETARRRPRGARRPGSSATSAATAARARRAAPRTSHEDDVLRHVERERRVRPVVERRLEHDERERDAAVEAHLRARRCPSPAAERVQHRGGPAHDERQRIHSGPLDEVEDDPG